MFLPFLPAAPTDVASTPRKTADDQGSLRTGPEGARNTVRKVLRSGETAFKYERNVQPSEARTMDGRTRRAVDEHAAKATREQLTLIRTFEQLRERGYEDGYDAVRHYARRWAKQHGQATAAAYVPLSFAPGEAYQFDWSHEVVLLNGVP